MELLVSVEHTSEITDVDNAYTHSSVAIIKRHSAVHNIIFLLPVVVNEIKRNKQNWVGHTRGSGGPDFLVKKVPLENSQKKLRRL